MCRFPKRIQYRLVSVTLCLFWSTLSIYGCCGRTIATTAANENKEFTNSVGMRFVLIPAGKSKIGSSKNEAYGDFIYQYVTPPDLIWEGVRETTVEKAFYMSDTEVTVAQFQKFRPAHAQSIPADFSFDSFEMAPFNYSIANTNFKKLSGCSISERNMPVTNISLDDALAFCKWLNSLHKEKEAGRVYRLPTEDEWEYACRAGKSGRFYWQDGEQNIDQYENVADKTGVNIWTPDTFFSEADDGFLVAAPVGSLSPNSFGLYDMLGNVYELTSSPFTSLEADPNSRGTIYFFRHYQPDSPKRPAIVVKGGSWCSGPPLVRCAARTPIGPDSVRFDLGFRLVVEIRK